ncbi:MAG: hypothetical protein ACREGB_02555 [Candidatus Saccharimonadales bacterium]
MKHLHLKKLNAKGFAHWILPAVVLVIIGGIGSYLLTASHADAAFTSASCTNQLGRQWSGTTCGHGCVSGAGSPVVSDPYDYCNSAASKLSSTQCASLHRIYTYGVCLKKWTRDADPCSPSSYSYVVANPYDKCVGSASTAPPAWHVVHSDTNTWTMDEQQPNNAWGAGYWAKNVPGTYMICINAQGIKSQDYHVSLFADTPSPVASFLGIKAVTISHTSIAKYCTNSFTTSASEIDWLIRTWNQPNPGAGMQISLTWLYRYY